MTGEFDRSVLLVLNASLGADFDPAHFEHVAVYDEGGSRIEMRLRSREAQRVTVADLGLEVEFAAGEEMRTEISSKFTRERVEDELHEAGMALEHFVCDPEGLFGVSVAVAR